MALLPSTTYSLPDLLLLAAALLAPLSFLFLRRLRPSSSPSLPLPPSPPALPLIGHLHHLLTNPMPHHALASLAAKLHTPILHLRLGQVPTVVVSTPELAAEVLKARDPDLCSRPQLLSAQYLSFGCSDVTFSPHGPYWRMARRICVGELLSARRVQGFRTIRREEVGRMLRAIEEEAKEAGEGKRRSPAVDVSRRFLELANDVLCRVAFGRRYSTANAASGGAAGGGKKPRLAEVLEETQALFAGFDVGEFFPRLSWVNRFTGLVGRLERNLADLRAVCDEIIAEHLDKNKDGGAKQREEPAGEREDFVDVLLRVQKSGDLEVPLTDDNVKALVLDMFVAGTDTTSATLEWVMTELARHPSVLAKAQHEVRSLVGPGSTPTEDHLPSLHYARAVVKETFRLHPPVPLLVPREALRDCALHNGRYTVKKGTRVLVNTYAIGRDPGAWDAPEEFRPERFVDGDEGGGVVSELDGTAGASHGFSLLPFGGGRRGCPGYSFALPTAGLALAALLYHFDWELPEGVKARDVDLTEVFGLATRKKEPLVIVPTVAAGYELVD